MPHSARIPSPREARTGRGVEERGSFCARDIVILFRRCLLSGLLPKSVSRPTFAAGWATPLPRTLSPWGEGREKSARAPFPVVRASPRDISV